MTASEFPIPIEFELPPHWERVDPAAWGVVNAAFLAVRRGLDDDYTPTISISGAWRTDDASVEEIADESLTLLRAQGVRDVELAGRKLYDGEHAPAVLQMIGATIDTDGRPLDLRQMQVVTALTDLSDPERRAVLLYTLSCTFRQFREMGREFQSFVATAGPVRPAP